MRRRVPELIKPK